VKTRNEKILFWSRIFGHVFAFALVVIIVIASLPNHFFLVSSRAVINAPVQPITSRIAGRVTHLDLQIGQAVEPGQIAAKVENFDIDGSVLVSLRRERLELGDQLSRVRSKKTQTARQLELIREQIGATRRGVIDDLSASTDKAENNVRLYEARVREQESLLDQKARLVQARLVDKSVLEPLKHKLDAAEQQLNMARGDLAHQRNTAASIEAGNYAGDAASNLVLLELQVQSVDLDHTNASAELDSLQERLTEVDQLIAVQESQVLRESSAHVSAQHRGRIVSIEVAPGDYVVQGGLIARSLDCSKSFVAAVFAGRDLADLEIDTPALVNIPSLGTKHRGRIEKTARYYKTANETLYYKSFPKAEGHEIYVIIELDDDKGRDNAPKDDLFFGCHVGEEVTVALGEPLTERAVHFIAAQQARLAGVLTLVGSIFADEPRSAHAAGVAPPPAGSARPPGDPR
jgi:multidrug resistance efflux pump